MNDPNWRVNEDGFVLDVSDGARLARISGLTLYLYNRRQRVEIAVNLISLMRLAVSRLSARDNPNCTKCN